MFMFLVNFMSRVCMLWIWNSQWLGIIILQSLEKGVPWKFWLDPQFPRDPKLKRILKWLSLDRGYFKFCFFFFYKRRKFANNLVPYILFNSQFCCFVSSHVRIAMHFVLVELSRNLLLLIDDPSKRGDVKTLARSSISPSPQVKMKLKLTASR